MAEGRLRGLLTIQESVPFNDGHILTKRRNGVTFLDVFYALGGDIRDGVFGGYKKPKLITNCEGPSSYQNPLQTISTSDGVEAFYQRIEDLLKAVRERELIPYNVRLGDNWGESYWDKSYDVIAHFSANHQFHGKDGISVARGTTTEHLQPIVDGRIDGIVLTLFREGNQIYSGCIYSGYTS